MTKPIKLVNTTSGVDEWEIAWFNTDCNGLKLDIAHLGIRVNGGTWMDAVTIFEHIQTSMDELPIPEDMR